MLPFFAALLLVGGCQQTDLPSWVGGTKPAAEAPAPSAPPSPTIPVAAPVVPVPAQVRIEPLPPPEPLPQLRREAPGEASAALLVPLSGPYAGLGQAMSNAAQMALFDVADDKFHLVPFDTGGTAEGAARAARQALAQGVNVVLGPLFAHEVRAVAPLARAQGVPVVAFTTDRTAVGNGVYAMGILPGPQVNRVVSYAGSMGRERFALLAPANDTGRAVADALARAALANGVRLVKTEFYDPDARDHTALVKRFTEFDQRARALNAERARLAARADDAAKHELKRLEPAITLGEPPFDALLIPDEGTRLRTIASMVTYFDIDPTKVSLLGTLQWDDPRLGVEPALVGGLFAAPPAASHAEFERRYAQAFGPLAPKIGSLAGIAYDATALAAVLARQGYSDYPEAALTSPDGFSGIDGIFRLTPDGTAERGLEVREVTRSGSRVISPAPTSFGPQG